MPEDERIHLAPAAPGPPRLLGDRYELVAVAGSGASAVTWRGRDRRLDRRVAIKILRREGEQDEGYVRRFEREARTSASISHGHVVNVYDVGQEDGWLYLVMQFVEGEDLKHLIARRGPLPVTEARDIARQILDGLVAIHGAGILHRDIKPQNVLVDREGIARVADFGIAQTATDVGLTMAGTAVGTAAYMAPEQARAEPLSEATDIYAVGAVLYEMLTGEVPFERPTAMATMLAQIQEDPIPPSRRAPGHGIPARLDGIVLQAMAKRPEDRFRSAAAMSRALDGNLDPGATTRIAPVAESSRTRVEPAVARNQARPATVRPPVAQSVSPAAGPGGRGLLNAVLVLILLAMTVVAAYTYYEYMTSRDNDDDAPPTAPVQGAAPSAEPPTEDLVILPPGDGEPDPTELPPPTDEPGPTPEPTEEPTEVPIEPADDTGADGGPGSVVPGDAPVGNDDPIIEPDGGG